MARRLGRWVFATSIVAGLVLLLAGTFRDAWLWAYVGVWAAATAYALLGMDEELAKERFRPPTAGADAIAIGFLRLFALSHLVVGALDGGRWHLTAPVPPFVRASALAGMATGLAMFYRAMRENRFFSSVGTTPDRPRPPRSRQRSLQHRPSPGIRGTHPGATAERSRTGIVARRRDRRGYLVDGGTDECCLRTHSSERTWTATSPTPNGCLTGSFLACGDRQSGERMKRRPSTRHPPLRTIRTASG